MSIKKNNKRQLKTKLSDHFRMVIIDDDTLKEVKTMRFTLLKLSIGLITIVLSIMGLTYCLIAFTPIKYLVPGYADINNNAVYIELSQKIEELEKDITAQRTYTEGFKNFLNPTGVKINDINNAEGSLASRFIENDFFKQSNSSLPLEHYYFYPPISGEISSEFNIDKSHYGLDIVAPKNTPIMNILDGMVINSDWSDKTGYTISIQHNGNLVSIFKHNSVLLKKIGERVKKGEAIAIIGNTGELTSGPHVHFELWNNGIPLNPQDYIQFNY